jgi:protein SCO1/2
MAPAAALLLMTLAVAPARMRAAQSYPVTGIILKVDQPHRTIVASINAIPGYMEAMVMPFSVREPQALSGLQPGAFVDFTLVVEKDDSYVLDIRLHHFQSLEQEALRARRLQLIEEQDQGIARTNDLSPGQLVPDFTLIDQTGRRVTLSEFRGRIVALTFFYTTCPLPNYCLRLSNNFARLQKRFAGRLGKDLELLSITFDPVNDQPDVLARYASTWKVDPSSWHFLTGPPPAVKAVCREFGVSFWSSDGTFTHALRTAVIDRQGRLAANLEGNEFSAEQLGDLVQSTLEGAR